MLVLVSASGTPGSCEAVDMLATYAGTAPNMPAWTKGTENLINTDANLRLQYIAGMGVNNQDQEMILNNIVSHYKFPADIFYICANPDRVSPLLRNCCVRRGAWSKGRF